MRYLKIILIRTIFSYIELTAQTIFLFFSCFLSSPHLDTGFGTGIKSKSGGCMKQSIIRQQKDDHGDRRRLKDRRFQVPASPSEEKRTNWRRRNGWDQRIQNQERTAVEKKEKPAVP
jgi:hypothetical protein